MAKGSRGKAKRKRDYKAEYRARLEKALREGYSRSVARGHPRRTKTVRELGIRAARKAGLKAGANIAELVRRDMLHTFGTTVRKTAEDASVSAYVVRLDRLKQMEGEFDWTNEEKFIEEMQALGLTEREAYSALFGSP